LFKDAVWLAKKEYKHHWMDVILTFLICMFIGSIVGLILADSSNRVLFTVNSISVNRFILDLFFIGAAPAFATLFMSKPYLSFKAAKNDPYGKRMAVLRSLPIPVSVLALSRTFLMLSTLAVMSFAFFGTMATVILVFSNGILEVFTVDEFFVFIFVWLGFMLALGGMNPYIEYGTNGKALHILPHIFIGLFIIVEIIFYNYFSQGMVEASIVLVKDIGWPLALFSVVIGVICCYGWNKLLKRRLENRDYV